MTKCSLKVDGDCHGSTDHGLAMTGNSLARNDGEFGCGNLRRHCDRIPPKDGNTPVSALFLTLYHPHLKKASRKVELRLVQGAGRFVQKRLQFLKNSI